MTRGFSFSLPVMVVVSAIAFVYFCTVFVFIDRWFGLMTSPGIMNAVAFTGVAVMCVLNYVFAIFMDPGRVPSTFLPDIEDSKVPIHEIKRKINYCSVFKGLFDIYCIVESYITRTRIGVSDTDTVISMLHRLCQDDALAVLEVPLMTGAFIVGGDLRYCQKCSHFKPPRAHHCRVCKICVLRMVLLVGSLTNDSQNDKQQSADSFRILYVISGVLLVPLSMALSGLLGWHIYLILQNKTTIEYHEGVRATWLEERAGNIYKHPYDLGAYDNLTTVLGSNIICWICPTSKHIGNGLRFRTAYDGLPVASTSK
ncbi:putative protein S-acyltransferase 16 isoform X1 [Gossypium australe]|uniref:S-acyltransferase n=1 Tax=Gossypium australe TaxID=47621 RepID=A0A5B6VRX7_9ROSI|nr:putative protein S-acyltransferase 16 isoform X1 [Gossypium australe]